MTGASPAPRIKGWNVSDDAPAHQYFTMMPNLIDELGLDVYAFRLYVHLKRVAGDSGECYQSEDTLATTCGMSHPKVTQAKRTLTAKKLITVKLAPNPHGGLPCHHIHIMDIWQKNLDHCTDKGNPVSLARATTLPERRRHEEEPTLRETSGTPVSRAARELGTANTTIGEDIPLDSPKTDKPERGGTAHREMFAALVAEFAPPANDAERGRLNQSSKLLRQSGATPETIPKLVAVAKAQGWKPQHITPLSIAANYTVLAAGLESNGRRMGVANVDGTFYI